MKDTKKPVFTIIGVALVLPGGVIPPLFGLPQLGMQVICIFALMLTPLYTCSKALNSSMGGWITSFVLFSSMVTYALRQTGFSSVSPSGSSPVRSPRRTPGCSSACSSSPRCSSVRS